MSHVCAQNSPNVISFSNAKGVFNIKYRKYRYNILRGNKNIGIVVSWLAHTEHRCQLCPICNMFEFLLSFSNVFTSPIYYLPLINQKALKIIIPVSKQITFGGFWPWEEKGLSVAHLSIYEYVTRIE